MLLVIDSTFVIDHLRGDPAALLRWRRIFEEGDVPVATEIVVCEVRAGLRTDAERYLRAFIEPVEFVEPGVETALTAGRWRAEVRSTGRTLSLADALIAAAAHTLGAAVLTRNTRDFALTPVRIETY